MINIVTVFVYSWLWRTAGRGGFPNALWIRKVILPYIAYLITQNIAFVLLTAIASMLPITYQDDEITERNTWWLWLVGAVYGLGISFLFTDIITSITSFLVITSFFACGVMVCDYTLDQYAEDIWYLFEYCFGALLGLSVILS